jgi:Mrp family chromosome partitioning ATPase
VSDGRFDASRKIEEGSEVLAMSRIDKGLRSVGDRRGEVSGELTDRVDQGRSIAVIFEELQEAVCAPSPVQAAVVAPGSDPAEGFRLLRTKVRGIAQEKPFRCVGIVSATPGEGKTTVALGLAAALADAPNRRVLLVESDFRRPTIENYLGLPRTEGLSEWLGGSGISVPVRRAAPHGFWLLSAGIAAQSGQDALAADRMTALLETAREQFDDVVVDCPPLAPVADSVMLQDLLDGFLLVVRSRHAPRELVLQAVSHLKPERVGGIVFNDQEDVLPAYDFSYSGYRRGDGR